jgi:hypothetical protein
MTDQTTVRPVINHVAISVDADVLDEAGRASLVDFFGEVFGWVEGDNSTEQGNPLILYTGELRQYLYLLPSSTEYLRAPRLDHFGLEIGTRQELVDLVERARAYQARDDRVTIIDVDEMVTHGTASDFTLTHAYVGFLIPLLIELQHLDERPTA